MPLLHYGPSQQFELDEQTAAAVLRSIGNHASRGGWVSFTDVHGTPWSILITVGVPIFVDTTVPGGR